MKGGVGHPLVFWCAPDPEVLLTPVNLWERVDSAVVLQKLQLVSHGHEVVPQLIIVGTKTLMPALLVAIRQAHIMDSCLYAHKCYMKGTIIASLIHDHRL
jgi:hypothetical protein